MDTTDNRDPPPASRTVGVDGPSTGCRPPSGRSGCGADAVLGSSRCNAVRNRRNRQDAGECGEQVPKPCSVNLHSMATRLPAPFSSTSTLVGLGSFKQRTSFSKSSVHLVRGWRVDIKLRIPLDKPPIAPDPTPSSKDSLRSADKHPGELLPDEGSPEPCLQADADRSRKRGAS